MSKQRPHTIGEAIDRYWTLVERRAKHPPPRGLSPSTVQTYRYNLDRLSALRSVKTDELDAEVLLDAFDPLIDASPSGARASWIQLQTVLRHCGVVDFPRIRMPRKPKRGLVLTAEERSGIIAAVESSRATPAFLGVIRLCLETPLRRGAACRVQWRNLDGRCLTITSDKHASEEHPYTIILSRRALGVIHRMPRSSGWIFDHNGSHPKPDSVYCLWRRLCRSAQIRRKLRLHDLRHTNATLMILGGVPDSVVESQMGHYPSTQARFYQHPEQLPSIVGPMIDRAMEVAQ